MPRDTVRLVALGASNLTRGFHHVVAAARTAWGRDVEVIAALGHGRSYGVPSAFLFRTLPGILECGLWRRLEPSEPAPTRALVTDVGNDILYGFPPEQVLAWVEEAVGRLQRVASDVALTNLPLATIRKLKRAKFLAFRSVLVPRCRLSLEEVVDRSEQVDAGLAALAAGRGARLVPLDPAWYGFDPIHIRPRLWRAAWQEILGEPSADAAGRGPITEALRLYFLRPERRWLAGRAQVTPQRGVALPSGGRVWLY